MAKIRIDDSETDYIIKQVEKVLERAQGLKDYGVGSDRFTRHAIGFAGEYAVSKYLYLKKPTFDLDTRHGGDVGPFEVRTTPNINGRLLLNQRDWPKRDRAFIHVISLKDRWFKIVGWLYGYEVMRPENYFERPQFKEAVYKVENHELRQIEELQDGKTTHSLGC